MKGDKGLFTYSAKLPEDMDRDPVYDGDTLWVDIDLGFMISQRIRLRLLGIDAPELRGQERAAGILSRNFLRSILKGEDFFVKTEKDKTGKYGRYLATVFLSDGTNVNDLLVSEGHAEDYS